MSIHLVHPLTGIELKPLGIREDGRPIWPILGGAEDDGNPPAVADDDDDGDGTGSGADALGDAGKRALEAERAATKKARDELRPWKALSKRLGSLTPEQVEERLNGISRDGKTGEQIDVDKVRREAVAEARQQFDRRIVRAEVRALAVESFADPEDAVLYLDKQLGDFDVTDDGDLEDADAVKRALADLLKRKPHLAKRKDEGDGDGGDFDGGARGTARQPTTMSDLIRNRAGLGSSRR